jgi:GTP pyrophosphokinase
MFDFPVEIQVRTEEMDRIAEYGVAAHFAYKEHDGAVRISDSQAEWIRHIQDIVQKYQSSPDKETFKSELDIEILQKSIYVYTPQGDIIELPPASTVLDFAFRVHTDV